MGYCAYPHASALNFESDVLAMCVSVRLHFALYVFMSLCASQCVCEHFEASTLRLSANDEHRFEFVHPESKDYLQLLCFNAAKDARHCQLNHDTAVSEIHIAAPKLLHEAMRSSVDRRIVSVKRLT